jgi:hypothetical protein
MHLAILSPQNLPFKVLFKTIKRKECLASAIVICLDLTLEYQVFVRLIHFQATLLNYFNYATFR